MKLLQINITANWGSHGKIAEGIGQLAIKEGWESYKNTWNRFTYSGQPWTNVKTCNPTTNQLY